MRTKGIEKGFRTYKKRNGEQLGLTLAIASLVKYRISIQVMHGGKRDSTNTVYSA